MGRGVPLRLLHRAVAVVLGVAAAVGAAAQAEDARLQEFLKEFTQKREAIGALTADFAQENIIDGEVWSDDPALGTVTYAKPKRILFTYQDTGASFLIDNLRIYDYDPGNEQLRIVQLEDRPEVEALFLGFSEDFAEVQQAYNLTFFDTGDAAVGLELTPKATDGEEQGFERARLWLRPDDYLPTRVEVTLNEDSINTYYLSEYEIHDTLPRERVQIAVPAGTVVVEGNAMVELDEPRQLPIDTAPGAAPTPLPPPTSAPKE